MLETPGSMGGRDRRVNLVQMASLEKGVLKDPGDLQEIGGTLEIVELLAKRETVDLLELMEGTESMGSLDSQDLQG